MKRFFILLAALLFCACAPKNETITAPIDLGGAPTSGQASAPLTYEPDIRTKPPKLRVLAGEQSIAATMGSYSWTYPNGDGTDTGVDACGMHPLDMLDLLEPLPIGDADSLTLSFSAPSGSLKSITVRGWDLRYAGRAEAGEPNAFSAKVTRLTPAVSSEPIEACIVALDTRVSAIYEVHAYWEGDSHGDSCYAFRVDGESAEEKPLAVDFSAQVFRTNGYRDGAQFPQTYVIRSAAELTQYLHAASETYYITESGMADALKGCDDTFFAANELVLIVLEEGSGSVSHTVSEVALDSGSLIVPVLRHVPEVGTCDMAEWHIVLTVPAGTVSEQNDISVIFPDPA